MVALNPAGGTYPSGMMVTLTAIPTTGHYFAGWRGATVQADNPLTLRMTADKVITAIFSTMPPITYTLTVHTVGQGTVAPGTSTQISGTTVSMQATPDDGWQVGGLNWPQQPS